MTLPSHWTQPFLHQVAQVQTGLSKSQNRTGPTVRRPYLRVANVQDGYLDLADVREIDVPSNKIERFRVRGGDILLTEGGDFDKLGRGCLWNEEIPNCVHQNHIFAVRVKDRRVVLPQFLASTLQSQTARAYFLSCSKQTTNLASINSAQLRRLPVVLPPLEEQHSILRVVDAWDSALAKAEQLVAAKQRHKLALMETLLTGRRRLSGFDSGWRKWRLGDLFVERRETSRTDLPLLSISREEGVVDQASLDRKDSSNEDKSQYLRICPGDIGYNTMRMWQGVSALSGLEGIVSPAYTVCIPGKGIDGEFAAYLFKLPRVVHNFYRYSQGLTSDTWNLKFRHFSEIEVLIPETSEQSAIATLLGSLDAEIEILTRRKDRIARQKRGILQRLLTGEWRLPAPPPARENG